MHAIVLAGGYATRLWPITKNRPKMLLPIGERTVIGTIFRSLEEEDRIDDVYVSTNEAFADTFETYLDDADYETVRRHISKASPASHNRQTN